MGQSSGLGQVLRDVGRPHGDLAARLATGALIGAAGLIGFGVILWIAANWDELGKMGRFALVGVVVLTSGLVAIAIPSLRQAASLVGTLAIGGLLALHGQTYQTGADAWQLFALWAALTLPWAIAARHDAVWALWVVVVSTALPLWVHAETGGRWQPISEIVLPAWLGAGLLAAAFSPAVGLERWIGQTRWSFRLATVLALGFVASLALPALFIGRGHVPIYFGGLLVTAGVLAALIFLLPFDLALAAVATLALDVLLISGIVRVLFEGHGSEMGSFLLTGLLSAGIVAGSAVGLLRLARERSTGGATASAANNSTERTWPVVALSGIGAVLAALPFLGFVFMLFGNLLHKGPGVYVLGVLMAGATVPVLRKAAPLGFVQQLTVIALAVGLCLVGIGLFRDLPEGTASLLMAVALVAVATAIGIAWTSGLLGAAAAAFLAIAIASTLDTAHHLADVAAFRLSWLLIAAATAGALLVLPRGRDAGAADLQRSLTGLVTGAAVASLFGLMAAAGPTFLLGGTIGFGGARLGTQTGALALWNVTRLLSVACALAAVALLLARRPDARTPIGIALAVVLIVLSAVTSALGPALLAISVAIVTERRILALLAAFAGLWILGAFYYWLGWPLVHKAYLLVGLGLALGAVAFASGVERPAVGPTASALPAEPRIGLAAGLIAIALVATGAMVGTSVSSMESTLKNGRAVYIALAPVDPRSLLQGDFMALRFALPTDPQAEMKPRERAKRLQAVATLDARSVATITSLTDTPPTAGTGELRINLQRANGRATLGPNAFFFKEGTGERYAQARFGEFRITPDGRALLVGLADADLKPIR